MTSSFRRRRNILQTIVALLAFAAPSFSLPDGDVAEIAIARGAAAEMAQLARTPEEKALAERDRVAIERVVHLLEQRSAALAKGSSPREAQMSFSLQYRQLQSQMQHENRSYTAISNIMKTKHETVKNSISNVR